MQFRAPGNWQVVLALICITVHKGTAVELK